MRMNQAVKFIGKIESPIKTITESPLQGNENAPGATIIIFPEFAEGVKDIKGGDEIILLTWLHLADRSALTCYPRNNTSLPLTGIFSTRSPDRPNPIGMHPVKVISADGNGIIKVAGLEAIDKTPVIDIKPIISRQGL